MIQRITLQWSYWRSQLGIELWRVQDRWVISWYLRLMEQKVQINDKTSSAESQPPLDPSVSPPGGTNGGVPPQTATGDQLTPHSSSSEEHKPSTENKNVNFTPRSGQVRDYSVWKCAQIYCSFGQRKKMYGETRSYESGKNNSWTNTLGVFLCLWIQETFMFKILFKNKVWKTDFNFWGFNNIYEI